MSYVDFTKIAIEMAQKATELDRKKQYEQAYKSYVSAIQYMMTAAKHEKVKQRANMLKEKAIGMMDRAEEIKTYLANKREGENEGESGGTGTKEQVDDKQKSKEQTALEKSLMSCVLQERPNVKWDDVAGLENAKETLKEAVILPLKYPHFFEDRDPWRGVLLYGPPGTGKSYLAKAVATEAKSMFFSVSTANLTSKWVGDSEKLVRALFDLARKNKPSVIFIDEIDSLCGARSTGGGSGGSDAMERLKTQFLIEMDGVGKSQDGILVLGATNLPQKLDIAVRRRFEQRVYIPLPESEARLKLLKMFVGKVKHNLTEENFQEIAKKTEGYSGADINIFVRKAKMEPIKKVRSATHFKKITGPYPKDKSKIINDLHIPCSPSDEGAMEMTLKDCPDDKVITPDCVFFDFIKALQKAKKSVNDKDLQQYVNFTKDFGVEG